MIPKLRTFERDANMSWEEPKLRELNATAFDSLQDQTVAILAVGDSDAWLQRGNGVPQASSMRFVSIEDVTDTLLAQLCPTVIISPALSKRFDCIDLAQLLCRLEYKGRYRAVSHELPNPKMIEREIRSICPNLDFGVLTSD